MRKIKSGLNVHGLVYDAIEKVGESPGEDYPSLDDPLVRFVRSALIETIELVASAMEMRIDTQLISIDGLNISPDHIVDQLDYIWDIDEYFREEFREDQDWGPPSTGGNEEIHMIFNREYSK